MIVKEYDDFDYYNDPKKFNESDKIIETCHQYSADVPYGEEYSPFEKIKDDTNIQVKKGIYK